MSRIAQEAHARQGYSEYYLKHRNATDTADAVLTILYHLATLSRPGSIFGKAMFKIFCKRANCDAQMISGAGGRYPR